MKNTLFVLLVIFIIGSSSIEAEENFDVKVLVESIDSLITESLNKEEPLIGGSIALVTSNQELLVKGYGFSDIKQQKPFDSAGTIAMTASVSKVVTVTAFLKLLESGLVSLEQPVKDLIPDVKIINPYDQPVLIKHLLTHTAGFDDSSIALEAREQRSLLTIKEQLQQKLPPVVWPPGKFYNYSNYGMVLLAHIIETISEQPFNQYMEKNIFQKLSMENSGFDYNNRNAERVMRRYKWKFNEANKLFLDSSYGLKYTHQIGASGFHTTASDMVNFMQMYLNSGSYENKQILEKSTIQEAFQPHFSYHDLLARKQGLVWRVRKDFGVEYQYHSGDDTGIESLIMLVPEADIGLFFVGNSGEGSSVKFEIRDLILSELSKLNSLKIELKGKDKTITHSNLSDFEGSYQYMNDGQTSIEKLQSLFGDTYNVIANENSLLINGNKYLPLKDNLFERESNGTLVKFVNDNGRQHFSLGYGTYRQFKWYEKPSLHLPSILLSLGLILIINIGWGIGRIGSKRPNKNLSNNPRLYLGLSGMLIISFLAIFILTTIDISMKFGVPENFNLLFSMPIISLVLFAFGFIFIPKYMSNKSENSLGKIVMFVYLLAITCCFLIFYNYNLIGFNYP